MNKIIPYKKKKTLNIWILVCVLVFIYLIIYFCFFAFDSSVSTCEVSSGYTASKYESYYNALALRNETVVNSPENGYVNFFVGDNTRIYVGDDIYVIDPSGNLSSALAEAVNGQVVLDSSALSFLNNSLYDFDTSLNIQNYYDTYSYKSKLESELLNILSSNYYNNLSAGISDGNYTVVKSELSGTIMHNIDGFEGYTYENVESSFFRKADYKRTIIKSNDYIEAGQPVYKVITDEKWNLVFQIADLSVFEGSDELTIEFIKDKISVPCLFSYFTKSGNTYGVLTLTKYMNRYLSDRYLQIKIHDDIQEGLAVPKTAVFIQQFYIIPAEYVIDNESISKTGFNRRITDSSGNSSYEFITPDIISMTDEYAYVSTDQNILNSGDILINNNSAEVFTVSKKENKTCVYAVENGYATMTLVEILGENGKNYIVDNSTKKGLREYDIVVEDSSLAKNGSEIQ